jgi:hypothetical protein
MSKNFSAEDVSAALDSLTKAGLTADQIMGGALSGALQIATCGDIPAWRAAEYAAAAINRAGLNVACGVDAKSAATRAIRDHEWKDAR